MPRKIEQAPFIGELQISKENYERLLMWSQSYKEINFICFGRDKRIEEVVRLSNTSRFPKKFANWHENVSKSIVRTKKIEGKKVIAWGHSHPYKGNDQHPSKMDIEAINKGQIELIVFPPIHMIRGWKISKTLPKTLKAEVLIRII